MAFDITVFNTVKRKNSTLIPTGGTNISVNLKNETSILSPTFMLESATMPNYSMVKWENRYYFINDIVCVRNNLFEIRCRVDPLASWKTNILGTTAFINYASVGGSTQITDNRIAALTSNKMQTKMVSMPLLHPSTSAWHYVLAALGSSNSSKFVNYYFLDSTGVKELADAFMGDSSILTELKQYFENPFDCIISLYQTKLRPQDMADATIRLGDIDTDIGAYLIGRMQDTASVTLDIPWTYSDFRRLYPFTSMSLKLPLIGVVDLNPADFIDVPTMHISATVDWGTGEYVYAIQPYVQGGINIATYMGNAFAQIPVAQVQRNWGGVVNNGISGLGNVLQSVFSGNPGGIFNAISNVVDGTKSYLQKTPSMIGSTGGGAQILSTTIQLIMQTRDSVIAPSNLTPLFGNPVMAVMPLTGKTGFVQTSGFSVSGNMSDTERVEINSLLDGGIYIE